MTEVFIFAVYPNGWTPRAIIVRIEDLDTKLLSEMNNMLAFGSLIEEMSKEEIDGETTSYTRIGFKNVGGIVIDTGNELSKTFSHWDHLANDEHFCSEPRTGICKCPPFLANCSHYYINDIGRNISPKDLQEKLMKMTVYNDKQIVVKHCILLSEVPINESKVKPVRFFYKNVGNISLDELENLIIDTFKFEGVLLAKSKNAEGVEEGAGYGYAYLSTESQGSKVINKSFSLGETVKITFDNG